MCPDKGPHETVFDSINMWWDVEEVGEDSAKSRSVSRKAEAAPHPRFTMFYGVTVEIH